MKWLQWSPIDLVSGLGGVEVHARSLARELKSLGVDPHFSTDPRDLERSGWDVVHQHGSAFRSLACSRAIRVHTLHGTTLGRMAACREWAWLGGYSAYAREIRGVLESDVVLGVHPEIALYKFARRLGKSAEVCWNGWDAGETTGSLPSDLLSTLPDRVSRWLYVGRGEDRAKGADRVRAIIPALDGLGLIAAPGSGFENVSGVIRTGRLSSPQIRELMSRADGLLLPSRYEGLSLVLLEALSEGLVVVATPVGGISTLPKVQGLEILRTGASTEISDALRRIRSSGELAADRKAFRKIANRETLPRWRDVAKTAVTAVERKLAMRKDSGK